MICIEIFSLETRAAAAFVWPLLSIQGLPAVIIITWFFWFSYAAFLQASLKKKSVQNEKLRR